MLFIFAAILPMMKTTVYSLFGHVINLMVYSKATFKDVFNGSC